MDIVRGRYSAECPKLLRNRTQSCRKVAVVVKVVVVMAVPVVPIADVEVSVVRAKWGWPS